MARNYFIQKFNDMLTESFSQEDFVAHFDYLTSKESNPRCTLNALKRAYQRGAVAAMISRYDPILYETFKNDYKRKYKSK